MDQRDFQILISHGVIVLPRAGHSPLARPVLATIAANLTHYGYALTKEGLELLAAAASVDVDDWWLKVEDALMVLTGEDKNVAEHVVYKNFPAEVLSMDEAQVAVLRRNAVDYYEEHLSVDAFVRRVLEHPGQRVRIGMNFMPLVGIR